MTGKPYTYSVHGLDGNGDGKNANSPNQVPQASVPELWYLAFISKQSGVHSKGLIYISSIPFFSPFWLCGDQGDGGC